ncbi:MAG: aromatic ring-hydroxylating oxygenase subunit alpha [Dehalococcoidia bacterium]
MVLEATRTVLRTPTEKAPEPDLGSALLAPERYISWDFAKREWDMMWTKVWNMAGRLQDVPNVGDYFMAELGNESLIIVREKEGDDGIRAYYNLCLHRGNRLIHRQGGGHANSFQCIYHFFEWNIDGSLATVPDIETFAQDVPMSEFSLREARCDTWGGFIFFNLNPDAEPLEEFLGIVPEHLGPYHFEQQYIVNDKTIEWDCNWKASVDAFNEVYHVQGIHPQLLQSLDDINVHIDLYERHNRYLVPFGLVSPRYPDQDEITVPLRMMMKREGIDPDTFAGTMADVRPALQIAARKHAEQMGLDVAELNDDQMTDDYHYYIFPNITLNIHHAGFMLFRQRPHPSGDPNKMLFDLQNFVRVPAGAGAPVRPEHEDYKHGDISLGLVLDQDAYNLPMVQKGMNSRGFPGLWINYKERRIRHMHKTIDDYLAGPDR